MHTPTSRPGHRALRKGRVNQTGRIYHLIAATCARRPWFDDPRAARAACRCFHDPRLLGDAQLLAWVLMPDHAHWLLELGQGKPLPRLMADLKSASARAANAALGRHGALWQRAYFDRALRRHDDVRQVARYIVANPLRAGLATTLGDYPYWNAIWL